MPFLFEVCVVLSIGVVALLPAAAQAQAIEAWVQRYNGPGNGNDYTFWPHTMARDTNGNVVVTGTSLGSGTGPDYVTIKYSSAGAPLWTNRYNGSGNVTDEASALALDASGNVFVTGSSYGPGIPSDWVTIKYSSEGAPLWTNQLNGPGNGNDGAKALAVDSSGNVIVAGSTYVNGYFPDIDIDYLTIKYSGAGVALWTNRYNGPGINDDEPAAVAVDASGNVVVTGYSRDNLTGSSYFVTIKYLNSGVPLWTNLYGGGNDLVSALALDSSGNAVVTGRSQDPIAALNSLTIKYSSTGVPLWTNRHTGTPNAIAVDASGSVYVTGRATGIGGPEDYATIKYSSTGVPLWTNFYNGPGNGWDEAHAVAVDASGNVYVTGESPGSGSGTDYATVAYSSAGVPLWTNRYNGPGNGFDQPSALTVDVSRNVYVTGTSTGSGSGNDFATVKYVVPPIITRQPLICTNALGTTASFTVEAAGGLPLSYQWRRQGTNVVDGVNISGVTTTNLQIANVQPGDAAGYSVVVTNAYGSVTSTVAQLTVTIPPNPGRFTKLSYSPDSGFSFIFRDATVGQPYRIQRSTSLAEGSWVDWRAFAYTEPIGFIDVGATGAERRFYRAVSP